MNTSLIFVAKVEYADKKTTEPPLENPDLPDGYEPVPDNTPEPEPKDTPEPRL